MDTARLPYFAGADTVQASSFPFGSSNRSRPHVPWTGSPEKESSILPLDGAVASLPVFLELQIPDLMVARAEPLLAAGVFRHHGKRRSDGCHYKHATPQMASERRRAEYSGSCKSISTCVMPGKLYMITGIPAASAIRS